MAIEVSNDAFGRAIKKTVEHLQSHHAAGTFGYSDMPSWDDSVVREIGEPESKWVNSKILRELNEAGLTETVAYEEFKLTQKGKDASVDIRTSPQ